MIFHSVFFKSIIFTLLLATVSSYHGQAYRKPKEDTKNCAAILQPELISLIDSYRPLAEVIIEFITKGSFKGRTFQELSDLVDVYPVRCSGHQGLEQSIDYMMTKMSEFGLENVRDEIVPVPHWVRGEESAKIVLPVEKRIQIVGLGYSVGTPPEGIYADVLVVKTFEELEEKQAQAPGRIVVFNQGYESYGSASKYRVEGASEAAKYGAVAALVESVASFSVGTPHTGAMVYKDGIPKIPVACITKEVAEYLYRLQERNLPIVIEMKMSAENLPMTTSRNVIGEIQGREIPFEYVAVSGHIDGWDLGQGALDDGGGSMISVMALVALKELGLRPRRTLETILWTAEEMGLLGAKEFAKQHKADKLANYSVIFESDGGTFRPKGLDFAGTEEAGCVIKEVLKLLSSINAEEYSRQDSVGSDISQVVAEGVPGLSLRNDDEKYFWYHHTSGDWLNLLDSDELDLGTAVWAVASYVLAEIPVKLPRKGEELSYIEG